MNSIVEAIYTGIPAWRKYAMKIYYTPHGETEEQSVILCPDHRMEFYDRQPSTQNKGERFPLADCEICKGKARFETRILYIGE